ncbi:MAG TPA: flagellar biosynthesis anti-sigma factor FlgM [bacterium]|nr:flagellar biosynthesis anti-sigma factor FlgM [bacterium]HOL46862.1 flagellar biosynthesis anti-sigma factor FlgM [bacterium]HPQ18789.1 flagellar biosynthesis anti-sigma factor FlgM [bacterium]
MGVEHINKIQSIQATHIDKKVEKKATSSENVAKDSVSISEAAKMQQKIEKIKKIVNETPDIRNEKIQEVMENIKNGTYLTRKIAEAVAEKLADILI